MFKCENCGKQSLPGQKAVRIVVETRDRKYVNVVNGIAKESFGKEIVKELITCGCKHD